jgi:hypothetical protein
MTKMMFGRVTSLISCILLSLGIRAAVASECHISGPRYQLKSDTVEWRMQIGIGQSCVRGLRSNNVANATINLVSPPQFGQVTLLGLGFSYTARSDVQDKDSFAVGVSGAINGVRGTSTIRIVVSIMGAPQGTDTAAPRDRTPAPVLAPALKAPPTPSVDNTARLPVGGSLPVCPTWDWSSGAPPPMRPPFDRSKLYCPPPPFNPPGQPIGCICPQ